MGIRFQCHLCDHRLHLKSDQAGRRGICPQCKGKIRIPVESTSFSSPLANESTDMDPFPEEVPSENIESQPVSEDAYWVRPPSGGEYGPATKELLGEWFQQNRLTVDTLISRPGTEEWLPLRTILPSVMLDVRANGRVDRRGEPVSENSQSAITVSQAISPLRRLKKRRRARRLQWIIVCGMVLVVVALGFALYAVLN